MEGAELLTVMAVTAINSALLGPSMILIATRAASWGVRSGLLASFGTAAGQMVYVVAALIVVGPASSISEPVHTMLRISGAGILLLLAIHMLGHTGSSVSGQVVARARPGSDLAAGLCVGLTNPFNFLFMFAVLPQVVSPRTALTADFLILFFAIFLATIGPKILAAWLGAGTRRFGGRSVDILMRIGALALIAFAGVSIASIA